MRRLFAATVAALLALGLVASAQAATTPRPTMTLHYVYNCTIATVEADFYRLSGVRDVYAQDDQGIWLIAQNVTFDPAKVYDGYHHPGGIFQVDIYVTAAGAGPRGTKITQKSTAAGAQCPTWYPVYDSHWVDPTPPAGSVPIEFSHIAWYRNTD